MHLTPEELAEVMTLAGFPRSITDTLVSRLTSSHTPDTVLVIVDTQLWHDEMKPGRMALSLSTALARHIHEQLGAVLNEIDLQPPI